MSEKFELTNDEKEQFLLMRGWHKDMGFAVPTPSGNDESDWTFVSTEDMFEAFKKGEKPCFSCEAYDWMMYDLEDAFEYEFENFWDDNNFEDAPEETVFIKIKELNKNR